jgi:hypothetical protein
MKLHLNVVQGEGEGQETQAGHVANVRRTEFRWNADYTAFRPVPLRWWDDASYARYQSGDDQWEDSEGNLPPSFVEMQLQVMRRGPEEREQAAHLQALRAEAEEALREQEWASEEDILSSVDLYF